VDDPVAYRRWVTVIRRVLALNRGWRYSDAVVPGSTDPDFDDAEWDQVCIPHANRLVPWHSFDDRDFQFVSVYRRRFLLPADAAGRVFLDFDGVMTAASPVINGIALGQHKGGYVPFSFEITDHVRWDDENVLAVEVDSTERPDIPPFGGRVDYLAFGGIYRDVALRIIPDIFVADVYAKPVRVLDSSPGVEVGATLDVLRESKRPLQVEITLEDGDRILSTTSHATGRLSSGPTTVDLLLQHVGPIELWDLDRPKLYHLVTRLHEEGRLLDELRVRFGFRDAQFTPEGFFLNGKRIKLRGLNRHQTYPFVGGAMPARVQRKDAEILKQTMKCNVVRTSHYPQSPHFLDRCDEIGLMVVEEIPGWQHIGDEEWKALACRDAEAMIRRDRNRPSIILWGVRINESPDDRPFYERTNEIARALDDSRPTGGTRDFAGSELLEDVFTVNDFNPERLRPPHHRLYLNTEYAGHTFPTKSFDHLERIQEHVLRHAQVLHQLEGDDRFAGGIAWCAFDYNTHSYSGSGDGICYHGLADIFRIPKPAADLYRSQCDPIEEIVLEPAFHWATGELHWQVLEFDRSIRGQSSWPLGGPGRAVICSNCDLLRIYFGDELVVELRPDHENFGNLPHPPFITDALARKWGLRWHDLRINGYVNGRLVITRWLSGRSVDTRFEATPDDTTLFADGSDATRITLRVTDEHGNRRPYASGAVGLAVEGPGEIIGENPFALVGGVGAVWLRATETAGTISLYATHSTLGTRTVEITTLDVPPEV
jgi:beta-galactosidase